MTTLRLNKTAICALTALCLLLLGGCHGGVLLVNTGTPERQDAALMAELALEYPGMEFTCTDHPEQSVHTVTAADGTEFTAWTPAAKAGEYQINAYYLEEWLKGKGYFTYLEEASTARGLGFHYSNSNHYSFFQAAFGELKDPAVLEDAVAFLHDAKDQFDLLMEEFVPHTGREAPPPYSFFARLTINGEEYSDSCYIGPLPQNVIWGADFAYDEYERYFDDRLYGIPRHAVEKNGLYTALAEWYGEKFEETEFDRGLHFVSDRVLALTETDITNLAWELGGINEETVSVTCGGYELFLQHGGMADDGYFWIKVLFDKDGNVLRDWEAGKPAASQAE